MKNHDKALVLRLLEDERFRIMQHAQKVKRDEGHDLTKHAHFQAAKINAIIKELDLKTRNPNELEDELKAASNVNKYTLLSVDMCNGKKPKVVRGVCVFDIVSQGQKEYMRDNGGKPCFYVYCEDHEIHFDNTDLNKCIDFIFNSSIQGAFVSVFIKAGA